VKGDLSISVIHADYLGLPSISLAEQILNWQNKTFSSPKSILENPEKEIHATFKLADYGGNLSSPLLKLYQPNMLEFHQVNCVGGNLDIEIPIFEGNQPFQILNFHTGLSRYPEKVTVREPIIPKPDQFPYIKMERNTAVNHCLQNISFSRKLEHLFDLYPATISIQKSDNQIIEADRSYHIEDYQLLQTMEDFLTKVLLQTKVLVDKSGKKSLRLYNPDTREIMEEEPWFMVNGKFVNDVSKFLEIPIKQIEQIDYFFKKSTISRHMVYPMFRGGVIDIWLREGMQEPDWVTRNPYTQFTSGVHQPQPFPIPVQVEAAHLPDFRAVLYWNPSLEMLEGKGEIEFQASSLRGKYAVRVKGIAEDGGLIEQELFFMVGQENGK
jgi:hypothetical protein